MEIKTKFSPGDVVWIEEYETEGVVVSIRANVEGDGTITETYLVPIKEGILDWMREDELELRNIETKENSKLEVEPKFRVGDIIRVKRFDVTGEITFVNTIDDRTLYVILVKDDASEIRMTLYESEIERIGYNKAIIEAINSEIRERLNDQNPLRRDIISKIEARFKKGDETYGQGVDIYDKRYNWVDMAEEELLDCLVYIVAETMRNGIRKNLRTAFYNVVHALLSLSEGGR